MKKMLSTKDVAEFLGVNEKMVYTLVSEKGLPASKVTGKWIFPLHLVEQWVEANTINYPEVKKQLPPYEGILIITGSNDLLLEKTMALFNRSFTGFSRSLGSLLGSFSPFESFELFLEKFQFVLNIFYPLNGFLTLLLIDSFWLVET